MDVLTVATETHGRVLVETPAASRPGDSARWLLAFHGYGQSADEVLTDVMKVPGIDRWHVAVPQALNTFYARRDERVVASWMTRQNREQAILDNVAYIDRVVNDLAKSAETLVFMGFSQGSAMAYRAAMLGRRPASGIIALAGDVPPELKLPGSAAPDLSAARGRSWPRVLIGVGREDPWYTPARCDEDEGALRAQKVDVDVNRFSGGHEWTDEFRAAAAVWLAYWRRADL
jgi:predicted esterase